MTEKEKEDQEIKDMIMTAFLMTTDNPLDDFLCIMDDYRGKMTKEKRKDVKKEFIDSMNRAKALDSIY